ncbi:MAG: hypothetical protein D6800_03820, partial [Candidatus Zixiibacteriota bacterium]
MWKQTALAFCMIATAISAVAQTRLNPDISVVGDFEMFSHNDTSRAWERNRLNLSSPGAELFVTGYLNPYVRASGDISWHGEEKANIEELYIVVLRGLPLGMNIRAGQQLLEFGRLNPVHDHAWSFIERPLPHVAFFGDEGANDVAVRASVLLPTGEAYTELMGGVLKGDVLLGDKQNELIDADGQPIRPELGALGRLTTSLAVADAAELALGASVINAVYDVPDSSTQLRAWVGGIDFKYKYKPSRYTTLQVEGEGLVRSDEAPDGGDRITSYGAYSYIDYRFQQRYNIGGIM